MLTERTKTTYEDIDEDIELEAPIPDSLHNDWKMKTMSIQVACIPDFERDI